MDAIPSSEKMTFLQPVDPYIQYLGLTRMNFLSIVLGIIFVLIYFLFSKQLYAWKESIKARLRKQLQGFTVQTHLSEDGKTLETTENPSIMARILSMMDSTFLAPDDEQEGFEDYDDSEEEFEEGFQDEDEDEDEEGDEEDDEDEEGDEEDEEDDEETEM